MKKIKALSAIVLLLFAAACSKSIDDTVQSNPAVTKKLTEATYTQTDGSIETETVSYDQQNRLSVFTNDNYEYSFIYESALVVRVSRKKKSNATIDQEIECKLNEKGAITQMVYKSLPSNTITYTYEVAYDANGYVTKVKGYSPSGSNFEEVFQVVDGNAVSSKTYFDGVYTYNREYIYDQSKLNKGPFSVWYVWPDQKLFGKPTKNLLKEFKSINMSGSLIWHTKSTYQVDADGYPVSMTIDYLLQGVQAKASYVFQ